ncbi:MAG: pyruvate dehydrogenase (acetyl-transferring) E1 component subunit alpha [Candidatus Sericytochromatia bacterium]|nr:pyruvate dehydrogenase (acetyl-transferring) E1 component subunit alpha [Candidatus Sericytochromatia bacterium]
MDRSLRRQFYRQMLQIRLFEEKCAELYAGAQIGGFLHLYIGEEAIAVGAIAALEDRDDIVTHYRDHGHALARGLDPNGLMAELCGRATGVCRGRGGSMHLADATKRFWGGYAIVGGHLPPAVGLAHAHQYLGKGGVSVCFFGDAATDIGEFHEAMNFAQLWRLPIVFVCENNLYGMGVPLAMNSAVPQIVDKARAYAMPSDRIDGMDVEAVYEAMSAAVAHARAGNGPFFLEAMTYRFRGHSMADPELYRDKAEVEEWKKKDPVATYRARLLRAKVLTQASAEALDAEVAAEVEAAARFALDSPLPDPDTLFDDVTTPAAGVH